MGGEPILHGRTSLQKFLCYDVFHRGGGYNLNVTNNYYGCGGSIWGGFGCWAGGNLGAGLAWGAGAGVAAGIINLLGLGRNGGGCFGGGSWWNPTSWSGGGGGITPGSTTTTTTTGGSSTTVTGGSTNYYSSSVKSGNNRKDNSRLDKFENRYKKLGKDKLWEKSPNKAKQEFLSLYHDLTGWAPYNSVEEKNDIRRRDTMLNGLRNLAKAHKIELPEDIDDKGGADNKSNDVDQTAEQTEGQVPESQNGVKPQGITETQTTSATTQSAEDEDEEAEDEEENVDEDELPANGGQGDGSPLAENMQGQKDIADPAAEKKDSFADKVGKASTFGDFLNLIGDDLTYNSLSAEEKNALRNKINDLDDLDLLKNIIMHPGFPQEIKDIATTRHNMLVREGKGAGTNPADAETNPVDFDVLPDNWDDRNIRQAWVDAINELDYENDKDTLVGLAENDKLPVDILKAVRAKLYKYKDKTFVNLTDDEKNNLIAGTKISVIDTSGKIGDFMNKNIISYKDGIITIKAVSNVEIKYKFKETTEDGEQIFVSNKDQQEYILQRGSDGKIYLMQYNWHKGHDKGDLTVATMNKNNFGF